MLKTILVSLTLTVFAATAAQAGGYHNRSSSLLGALVTLGNHGGIANVGANVGQTSRHGSSLADVNANLLGGAVRADVGVAQSGRRGGSLLDLDVNLGGGVGNRPSRW